MFAMEEVQVEGRDNSRCSTQQSFDSDDQWNGFGKDFEISLILVCTTALHMISIIVIISMSIHYYYTFQGTDSLWSVSEYRTCIVMN